MTAAAIYVSSVRVSASAGRLADDRSSAHCRRESGSGKCRRRLLPPTPVRIRARSRLPWTPDPNRIITPLHGIAGAMLSPLSLLSLLPLSGAHPWSWRSPPSISYFLLCVFTLGNVAFPIWLLYLFGRACGSSMESRRGSVDSGEGPGVRGWQFEDVSLFLRGVGTEYYF